jgi:hypothetical protein
MPMLRSHGAHCTNSSALTCRPQEVPHPRGELCKAWSWPLPATASPLSPAARADTVTSTSPGCGSRILGACRLDQT